MNKLLLVWIAALILLIIILASPLMFQLSSQASNNSNSTKPKPLVGLIGIKEPPVLNSSLTFQQVPTVNYSLSDYSIILIANSTYCDLALRYALAQWVRNGGKLIISGDSCTQIPGDPASVGWNVGVNSLGSVMPVIFGGVTTSPINPTQQSINIENGVFEIVDYSSFAFNNFSSFNFSGNVTIVYPFNGKVLGLITFENNHQNQTENQSFYAIVKSLNYNVFYLSFNPSLEPQITQNILNGLAG